MIRMGGSRSHWLRGLSAAEQLSIAKLATGAFMGWGQRLYRELGLGYRELVPKPAEVEGL
jgi:hypothetical protein